MDSGLTDLSAFPEVAIQQLGSMADEHIEFINKVVYRSIRPMDENGTLGFGDAVWTPGGPARLEIGQNAPPLNSYEFEVQILVRNADEAAGRLQLADVTNTFRQMVFTDADLHLALGQHKHESFGLRERFQRLKIGRIRYLTGELGGSFLQMSLTEIEVVTETC